MNDFDDFQVSAWLSHGMLTEVKLKFAEVLKLPVARLAKVASIGLILTATFCTFAIPSNGINGTVSGTHGVIPIESVAVPARVVDREISHVQGELDKLRAKLASRDFSGLDQDLLAAAQSARASAIARSAEPIDAWALTLVKSQFA